MRIVRLGISLALLAVPTAAQSLNLRYTTLAPTPAPTYGAVTGQAGVWNAIQTDYEIFSGIPVVTSLVGLDGSPLPATARMSGCDHVTCTWPGYGDDVQKLFAGAINGDCPFDPSKVELVDLQPGSYVLTAIGSPCHDWPINALRVQLSDQSYDVTTHLGGGYLGSFESMELGTHAFDLDPSVTVALRGIGYGYVSSAQLARIEPPAVYCTSKVNSQGCAAKIAAIGNAASLSDASPFHIVASDVVNDVPGLLFYGFGEDIKPFLGGLHCVKPPTPRVWGQTSGGNGVPCAGGFDQDFNAWLSFDPAPKVYAGARLYAQYWYRDVDDPFGSATSDAVSFHVVP